MVVDRTANSTSVSVRGMSGIVEITLVIIALLAVVYGFENITRSKPILYVSLVVLAVLAISMNFYKLLCIVTIAAAFNFTTLLFDPRGPYWGTQPFYMVILRDILLFFLFVNWFIRRINRKASLPLPKRISRPLIVYCFYILIRAVATMTSPLSSIRIMRYLFLYPLVLVFIVPYAFRDRRNIKRYLWIFIITGAVVAAIGIINVTMDFGSTYQISGSFEKMHGTRGRAVSTLANPNNLSAYLAMVIGVAVSLVIEGSLKHWAQKLFIWPIIGVAFICQYLTYSRGGLLALTLTLVILFGIRGMKNHQHRLLLLAVIVMILGFIMFSITMRTRAGSFADGFQQQRRIGYLVTAVEDMFTNPFEFLFGTGVGAHRENIGLRLIRDENAVNADNFFVGMWRSTGTIGLLIFLYLLLSILKETESIYNSQSDPVLKAGCSAALCTVLCITFWGIGAGSFGLFPAGYYVWIFVGLLVAIWRIKESETAYLPDSASDLSPKMGEVA